MWVGELIVIPVGMFGKITRSPQTGACPAANLLSGLGEVMPPF